jgi:ribosomal protein S18 acetylase RimI-like enzyme
VEVACRNIGALRLYESLGFLIRRRFLGFTGNLKEGAAGPEAVLREVDSRHVASIVAAECDESLPWFFEPASLFGCSTPTRGYALDDVAFGITTMRRDALNLRAIFVRPQFRRCGFGTRLLRGVATHESATTYTVLPFVPEGPCAEFFSAVGFAENSRQYELERLLL